MTDYYGLVYCDLSFEVSLWGGPYIQSFARVLKLQNLAGRIITKLLDKELSRHVFKNLNQMTLPCHYILQHFACQRPSSQEI